MKLKKTGQMIKTSAYILMKSWREGIVDITSSTKVSFSIL